MNATPPEANTEYSRGPERPGRGSAGRGARDRGRRETTPAGDERLVAAILAGALFGALLLFVAEFTTLYDVHASNSATAIKSVGTGSNHAYAMVPIALLVVVMAYGVWSSRSRPALLAVGVLGVLALLIALLGDLPEAHTSGLLGSTSTHYVNASSTPSAGFYMETLGAVLLLITCVCGFVLLGPPASRPDRRMSAS